MECRVREDDVGRGHNAGVADEEITGRPKLPAVEVERPVRRVGVAVEENDDEAIETEISRAGKLDELERIGRAGLVGVDFVNNGNGAGRVGDQRRDDGQQEYVCTDHLFGPNAGNDDVLEGRELPRLLTEQMLSVRGSEPDRWR